MKLHAVRFVGIFVDAVATGQRPESNVPNSCCAYRSYCTLALPVAILPVLVLLVVAIHAERPEIDVERINWGSKYVNCCDLSAVSLNAPTN